MANDAKGENVLPFRRPAATSLPVGAHLSGENTPSAATLGPNSAPFEGGAALPTHTPYVMVPVEPHLGVLVSMAVCLDHGFGLLPVERQESRLYDMRKLYDEVVGKGYYQPTREEYYQNFVGAKVKDEFSGNGPGSWTPVQD